MNTELLLCCPLSPANGDATGPDPKLSFGGAAGAAGLEPLRALPNEEDPEAEPNKLGFPAPPKAPKGEDEEDASFAKPELANDVADVLGLSVVAAVDPVESFASEGCSMLDLGEALADRGS